MIINFKTNRSPFLKLSQIALFLMLSAYGHAEEKTQSKPNIVYLNVDDLGWTDLTCQGSGYYETPNIDKLAARGMKFSDAYAPASNCAPSRACILTGQNTPRHGVYTVANSDRGKPQDRKLVPTKNTEHITEDNLTIAHALKAAGYVTCTIGKWHISKDPLKHGFDYNIAGGDWGGPYNGGYHSPYEYANLVQNEKGEYLTDRLTNEAIRFVTDNKDKPFFLYFPFYTVHSPLQAKPEKKEKFSKKHGDKAHDNPTYAAMIESLDENVGRLMTTLDHLGLAENTLVLFTSDNGGVWETSKQWPLRAGKGAYYEGGIRVPLIVRWPAKIKPGSSSSVPVSGLDFFPTFLEATGAEKPERKELDGVSFMPLLTQEGAIRERPLFWHFPIYLERYGKGSNENSDPKFRTRPGSVIRYGDWKLHEYFEDGRLELYNLKDDIGEKTNLAAKEPEKTKELHDMLKTWREKTGAPVPTELNPKYKP